MIDKIPYRKRFYLLIGLLSVIILIGLIFTGSVFASVPFSDDFEAYSTGLLAGQGSWEHLDSTGDYTVSDTYYHAGTKGVYRSGAGRIDKLGSYVVAGTWTLWINKNSTGSFNILLQGNYNTYDIGCGMIGYNYVANKISIYDMAGGFPQVSFDDAVYNEWVKIDIEWDATVMEYRARLNDGTWSDWENLYSSCDSTGIRGVRFVNGIGTIKIDDFSDGGIPPTASVWGEDPATETEITDLTDTLTIGFEALEDYDSLYVYFRHLLTGLTTSAVVFEVSELDEGGEEEITLSDFDFEKNGHWHLEAVASYESYLVEDGMFLSGYGSQFTTDLTDGDYYLDINIDGFEDVFSMSDFDSWYSDSITRFDSPTDMITSLTGFISPIFSYIGEFGSRIEDYFDNQDAYARGYDIGRSIPVFSYYVGQVAISLGGFPIMSTFFIILFLMVGVFIFKLVIRFIPHFGS